MANDQIHNTGTSYEFAYIDKTIQTVFENESNIKVVTGFLKTQLKTYVVKIYKNGTE